MKKVLLAGYYGHDNLGDEAIAEALTKELKRRGYDNPHNVFYCYVDSSGTYHVQ